MGKIFVICFLGFGILFGCGSRDPKWVNQIKNKDYEIISVGTYPYTTSKIIYKPEEFIELREKIEKAFELLPEIVRHFYPEEKGLDKSSSHHFKYKFGAIDGDKTILRYFARVSEDENGLRAQRSKSSRGEFAGYSMQFVFVDEQVHKIYLIKTPLEK